MTSLYKLSTNHSKVKENPFYNEYTKHIQNKLKEPKLSKDQSLKLLKKIIKKYSKQKPKFTSLGYITYKRTYARKVRENSKVTEEYWNTIERIVKGTITGLNINWTAAEIDLLVKSMLNLELNVSGRDLWQIGAKLFESGNMSSLINCWYFNIDKWSAFHKIFDMLMLGGGVGFSVQKHHISKLPKLTSKVRLIHKKDYVRSNKDRSTIEVRVGDSREGWCEFLDTVISMHQLTNDSTIVVDPQDVRKKGEAIKGFGGIASGFDNYWDGIQIINNILNDSLDKDGLSKGTMNSVEIVDIVCIIAHIVVSGNVRRSALLALGDKDDLAYFTMKRFDKYKSKTKEEFDDKSVSGAYKQYKDGKIPNYRYNANLSINTSSINDLHDEIWKGFIEAGEPIGFVNIENCKLYGRINPIDGKYYDYLFGENEYVDPDVEGVNPCAEATLPDNSNCCLAEIYLNNFDLDFDISSISDFNSSEQVSLALDKLTLLYKIKKHVTQGHYHYDEINTRINKDSRIGIGLTGIMQQYDKNNFDKVISEMYVYLRTYDFFYSKQNNMPFSRKLTVVKPSGTLSLLSGSTSGVHPAYSQYILRAVRMAKSNDLWKLAEDNGFRVEDDNRSDDTKIVYFPVSEPKNTKTADNFSSIEQMEAVKKIQSIWADQSVSVTVYYDKNNINEIKKWLADNYSTYIKTISFLQHTGHGFEQAPLTPITEKEYNEYISKIKLIESLGEYVNVEEDIENIDSCEGGSCPVR